MSKVMHWKRRKALAAYSNRWQWLRESAPTISSAQEIEMEHLSGYYLATEASIPASPIYIITE